MNKEEISSSSSTNTPINSTNIGFKLLKKQGWKEGTGLGLSQQGRLHPLRAHLKANRKGLGAEKLDKKKPQLATKSDDEGKKESKGGFEENEENARDGEAHAREGIGAGVF